jgi:hypothetical protein
MAAHKNNREAAGAVAILACALLLGLNAVTPSAVGAGPTQVKVTPLSQSILVGSTVIANVTIENVTAMGADQATVRFDPCAMTVSQVTEGAFLKSAGRTFGAGWEIINNTRGEVTFFYSLDTPGANVSGAGTLATISFNTNASARGSCTLNLADVLLATGTGGSIPLTILNGSVNLIPFLISLTSPVSKTYASTSVKLNFTVQPGSTVLDWRAYRLDGGANVSIAGNTTLHNLSAGAHQVMLYARDTGNYLGTSSTVYFTVHPGDCNGDKTVNVLDLQRMAWAFNAQPQSPNWNEATDLNVDNRINIFDVQIFAWNFGNTYT